MENYDPKKVNINIAGIPITAFKSFKVEALTKEMVKSWNSTDGVTGWSEHHDDRSKWTLTVQYNSPQIKKLDVIRELRSPAPVMVENKSGGAYIGGGVDGRIVERPDIEFEEDPKDVVFVGIVNDWKGIRK